jgi:hypothetical protein
MSDGLQPMLDDVRATVRRAASSIPPDFAGALARAHELAPDRVATIDVDDPAVIDIRGGDRGTPASEAALDDVVVDARAAVLRMVAEQRMHSIPAPPMPVRRRSPSRWVIGGLLAAATVVAAIGGYRFVELARERDSSATADQAFHLEASTPDEGDAAVDVEPEPRAQPPTPKSTPSLGPAPLEHTVAAPPTEPKALVRRASGLDEDELRKLSEEAHARWRSGDRRGAEQRFETITKKAKRGVQVELAWADLFALARQSGDAKRRVSRWKAYLAAFPRGRFADDARAGLCRAGGDAKCWSAYLKELPRGSYRAEAEVAIAGGGAR